MAHREHLNKGKDKRTFRETAAKTKAINIAPKVSRGGTRL